MFQNFTSSASPEHGASRLEALRKCVAQRGLSGFIIPRSDRFQGEYVAPCDERLAWLTGFTGSAGYCIVLEQKAGIFVDGRYRLQVREQVDLAHFQPVDWPETTLQSWLLENVSEKSQIGFDPWLHTPSQIEEIEKALSSGNISLVPCENLVDAIWEDRPPAPSAPFFVHPDTFAGETHHEKRHRLAAELRSTGVAAAVISLADSVAWLFNIRGNDIEKNPVPHAQAVLFADGHAQLFAAEGKSSAIEDHLGDEVTVHDESALLEALSRVQGVIQIDPASTPVAVLRHLEEAQTVVVRGQDPCVLPKARKNETEVAGMHEAHLLDGAAMVRFLAWMEEQEGRSDLTEIDIVTALEGFRREAPELRDISFDTICGSGPHGAIMHYRVTNESNRRIQDGDLIVVDSGGQYQCGTTDITRTLCIGSPLPIHRTCYTRVLQGLIAISRARFPKGVTGGHLDALARANLWHDGLDFDHGTGHGVGAYLCVHEGPQRLSRVSTTPLEPGMILSNEPGYYRNGAFGIRLENLIVTVDAPALPEGDAHRTMFSFENLTWAPFERRLIDPTLLTEAERDWINLYHAHTLEKIGPRVDAAARAWLEKACRPLSS